MAKRIGWVPQSPALLPWRTVARNARLLLEVNRDASGAPTASTDELLGAVGLAEFAGAYPHELSGGMRQRVALVRAMALGAPLLLMDEPFAALDEITRAEMRHLLAGLCEQMATTVVFVTHSVSEAVYLSDRVVVLSTRPGRIVGIEPIELARPRHAELEDEADFFGLTKRLRTLLQHDRPGGDLASRGGIAFRLAQPRRRARRHRRHRRAVGAAGARVRRAGVHPAAAVDDRRRDRRQPALVPRRGRGDRTPRLPRHADRARVRPCCSARCSPRRGSSSRPPSRCWC